MNDLDLLEADLVGESTDTGTSWWKWILGVAAAAGLTYYFVRDLPPGHLIGVNLPPGRRPW